MNTPAGTTMEEMERLVWDYGDAVHFYGNQGGKVAAAMDAVSTAIRALVAERDALQKRVEAAEKILRPLYECDPAIRVWFGDPAYSPAAPAQGEAMSDIVEQLREFTSGLPQTDRGDLWRTIYEAAATIEALRKERQEARKLMMDGIDALHDLRAERDALREELLGKCGEARICHALATARSENKFLLAERDALREALSAILNDPMSDCRKSLAVKAVAALAAQEKP